MSRFDSSRQHKTAVDWSIVAYKIADDDKAAQTVVIGAVVGLGIASVTTPFLGGVIGIYFVIKGIQKACDADKNKKYIKDAGCVAHVLESGNFRAYLNQTGKDKVLEELRFAEQEGLTFSDDALDFYEDNLESKEHELNEKLLRLEEKKSKIIETKLRIVDVRKVLSKRAPTTIRINTIFSFIPEDTEINRLSGKDNEMSFDIQSDSIATLNLLLEQKIEEIAADKKTGIKKIIMKHFGLSPKTLTYSVSFTVQFK